LLGAHKRLVQGHQLQNLTSVSLALSVFAHYKSTTREDVCFAGHGEQRRLSMFPHIAPADCCTRIAWLCCLRFIESRHRMRWWHWFFAVGYALDKHINVLLRTW
jgi:hypothetical protein